MFKRGDICVIADIGITSSHNSNKEAFIGKKVKFITYSPVGYIVTCNNFIQCELYAKEEIRLPARTIFRGQRFLLSSVKLRKIGNLGDNTIHM